MLWVELPDGVDALRLYEQARAEGIAIAPGPIFSATGRYENCFRLAASTPWTPAVERAIERLGELVTEQVRPSARYRGGGSGRRRRRAPVILRVEVGNQASSTPTRTSRWR